MSFERAIVVLAFVALGAIEAQAQSVGPQKAPLGSAKQQANSTPPASSKPSFDEHMATVHIDTGTAYEELGELEMAWAEYEKALKINPNSIAAKSKLESFGATTRGAHPAAKTGSP